MFVELRDIKELTTKLDAIRDFTSCVEHGRIFFYLFTEELQHTNRDASTRARAPLSSTRLFSRRKEAPSLDEAPSPTLASSS